MKSNRKNILIIGIGPMGLSHFESFYNSKNNYNIDLCDLNITRIKKKYKNHTKSQRLRFFKKIPKNNIYDLVIVSTNSKERYKIIKKLLKLNVVINLILEKFLFNKIKEYSDFESLIKKNLKIKNINVNSWGNYILKKTGLKLQGNFSASYQLRSKGLATNLIHISDLYSTLIKDKDFEILFGNLSKLKSKRHGYHEMSGRVILKSNKGLLKIIDNSKSKYHVFKLRDKKNNYTLQINNKKKCYFFKNKKLIKTFDFPMARIFTENFFRKSLIHNILKDQKFNNYKRLSFLSQKILSSVKYRFKRFNIT